MAHKNPIKSQAANKKILHQKQLEHMQKLSNPKKDFRKLREENLGEGSVDSLFKQSKKGSYH